MKEIVLDIWCERADKLFHIFNDSNVEEKKRARAFMLWNQMRKRITRLAIMIGSERMKSLGIQGSSIGGFCYGNK